MKFLFAFAFLALVAATLAAPPQLVQEEKTVEPVKTEDVKDAENVKDVRDKRGLLVTSYATAPIAAPVAYTAYAAPAPLAYSASIPVAYTHSAYVVPHASYVIA